MPRQRIENDAGLRANDRTHGDQDHPVQHVADDRPDGRDGDGFQHHGRSDGSAPGTERAQDRDLAATLVHRVVNARQHGARGHDGDQHRHEREDTIEPADLVEQLRHRRAHRPREGQPVAALVVELFERRTGHHAAKLHQHGAHICRRRRSVAGHVLHACDRNPNDLVRRHVRRLENPHHDIFVLVLFVLVEVQPVIRMKLRAVGQPQLSRRETSDHRLAQVRIEQPTGRNWRQPLPRRVFALGEHLHRRADDAVAAIVVAHRDRHRELHARMFLDIEHVIHGDVRRGCFEMEHGVENELELRAARAEHGVEAGVHLGERGLRLILHHPYRHQQTARQRDGDGGDNGRQRVLPEALEDDAKQGHGGENVKRET